MFETSNMIVLQACQVWFPDSWFSWGMREVHLSHLWSACGFMPGKAPGWAGWGFHNPCRILQFCAPFLLNNVQFAEQSHTFTGWVDFHGFWGTSARNPCVLSLKFGFSWKKSRNHFGDMSRYPIHTLTTMFLPPRLNCFHDMGRLQWAWLHSAVF